MENDRFTFSETGLAAAVRALREALGRSPEAMAGILGCSLPAYQKWEMGTIIPGGEWLIRMLQLCPDEETRNQFRIRPERREAPREKSRAEESSHFPLAPEERRRFHEMARRALDSLFECAESGSDAADSRLANFAINLKSAAEYYASQLSPTAATSRMRQPLIFCASASQTATVCLK